MIDSADAIATIRALDIPRTPRTERYIGMLEGGLEDYLANAKLDDLPTWGLDHEIRGYTAWTGFLAFHWACPMSRFHGDERPLRAVKARLLHLAQNQVDGEIVMPEMGYKAGWRLSLSNSWYLEPLIFAILWIENQLSPDERDRAYRMIRTASDLNMALLCDETNNRGVVRCAVLALSGRFLGDANYVRVARDSFYQKPWLVFNRRDGQINEGTGPDSNYSGTTYEYLYQYRLFSGDASVDEYMVDGLRWFVRIMDGVGRVGLHGASTRLKGEPGGTGKVFDILPALERYASVEPQFDVFAERYTRDLNRSGPHHSICPVIWALLEHEPRRVEPDPDYFENRRIRNYSPSAGPLFGRWDEGYDIFYYVFRRDHQGIVYARGRSSYQGFQHWTYGDEPPVIWPTISHASTTVGPGVNTSRQGVSGCKFHDTFWLEGPPNMLVLRMEHVWHHYLVTRTSVVLVIRSNISPREDGWVINRKTCGTPVIAAGAVTYDGRRGRMVNAQGMPEVRERENGWELRFCDQGVHQIYAFSNESFDLIAFDHNRDRLEFRDDTGRYEFGFPCTFHDEDALEPLAMGKYTLEDGVVSPTTGMISGRRLGD